MNMIARNALAKVPEIALALWIIKISRSSAKRQPPARFASVDYLILRGNRGRISVALLALANGFFECDLDDRCFC